MSKINLELLRSKHFDVRSEKKFNKLVQFLLSINENVAVKIFPYLNDWYSMSYHKGCWTLWYRSPDTEFCESDYK